MADKKATRRECRHSRANVHLDEDAKIIARTEQGGWVLGIAALACAAWPIVSAVASW